MDLLPLPAELGLALSGDSRGNPGDVVELRADIVVDVAARFTLRKQPDFSSATNSDSAVMEDLNGRIDWWLEMGGDEYVFTEEVTSSRTPGSPASIIILAYSYLNPRHHRSQMTLSPSSVYSRTIPSGRRLKKKINPPKLRRTKTH